MEKGQPQTTAGPHGSLEGAHSAAGIPPWPPLPAAGAAVALGGCGTCASPGKAALPLGAAEQREWSFPSQRRPMVKNRSKETARSVSMLVRRQRDKILLALERKISLMLH